jgi:hypothetical protein
LKLTVVALFLAACASQPHAAQPPMPLAPDAIPEAVVQALCQRLQAEGIASGAPVAIVRTTQPIVSTPALVALSSIVKRRPADPARANAAIEQSQRKLPVPLTGDCEWVPRDRMDPVRDFDRMIVELSAPVPNPFSANEAGVFARVSLGGQHPSWYWVALLPRGGVWVVRSIDTLAV